MKPTTVEFKFRAVDDHREWTEIPVSVTKDFYSFSPDRNVELICQFAASCLSLDIQEVRWNFIGSILGNFVFKGRRGVAEEDIQIKFRQSS